MKLREMKKEITLEKRVDSLKISNQRRIGLRGHSQEYKSWDMAPLDLLSEKKKFSDGTLLLTAKLVPINLNDLYFKSKRSTTRKRRGGSKTQVITLSAGTESGDG